MFKKIVVGLLVLSLSLAGLVGCSVYCKNPGVVSDLLNSSIVALQARASELNDMVNSGFSDEEVIAMLNVVNVSLSFGLALAARACPDEAQVRQLSTTVTQTIEPKTDTLVKQAMRRGYRRK